MRIILSKVRRNHCGFNGFFGYVEGVRPERHPCATVLLGLTYVVEERVLSC
jgi:hypothetical protein